MNFAMLTSQLEKALQSPLPGWDSQYQMAPAGRAEHVRKAKMEGYRNSGVLLLLYEKNQQPYFPLVLRNTYPGVHSGQVGFPGGKMEKHDNTLEETALRETEEEIGVPAQEVKILGKLSELLIPVSMFRVQPYVGILSSTPLFIPDPREVQGLIEVPVNDLLDPKKLQKDIIHTDSGFKIEAPYFSLDAYRVWGATSMMLNEFKTILSNLMTEPNK